MNLNTVQSSCAYQTHINQGMTNTQDSTEYIDLQAIGGRQPILSQCLEKYPEQKGIIYPNCENNFVEKSNQEAMICLTEFRTHPNGELTFVELYIAVHINVLKRSFL